MLAPRWRVVVALFVVTSCIATAVSTFGVFLPVLSDTFGWSRGAVSVVLSINLMLGGLAAFPVGRIADRSGPRAVLATTVAIGAIGFMLSSRIDALWQLYLSYGVLVGIGMSSIYVLTAATVARWFAARPRPGDRAERLQPRLAHRWSARGLPHRSLGLAHRLCRVGHPRRRRRRAGEPVRALSARGVDARRDPRRAGRRATRRLRRRSALVLRHG